MKRPNVDPDCFSLNNAVDSLLKNEFDTYRVQKKAHPIMIRNNIEAIPFSHELFPTWRNHKAGGIRYCDEISEVELFGVIDDVWINPHKELIIVDYKATAKQGKVILNLNNNWNTANKRQVSFYAFLFKKIGFNIHNTGYFVYNIADNSKPSFDETLKFETKILPYEIDDSWVEETIVNIRRCLNQKNPPDPLINCDYCRFNLDSGIN